jgi:phosphoribosylanthranilate isomerase
MTRVKICGIANLDDALTAVAAGADALGFVFRESPRYVSPGQARHIIEALPAFVTTVGVFLDALEQHVRETLEQARLDLVQLHGDESPEYCQRFRGRVLKRFPVLADDTPERVQARMQGYDVRGYMLDPGAGGGQTFDWQIARGIERPLIIAGGLTPENVGAVVRLLRPYAVDVSSGVEAEPGRKDPDRIRAFLRAVREADAT